jgi:hypothetical protein
MAVSRAVVRRGRGGGKLGLRKVRSSRRRPILTASQSVLPVCLREWVLSGRSTGYTTYWTANVKCRLTSTSPPSSFHPPSTRRTHNPITLNIVTHPYPINESIIQFIFIFIFIFVVCIAIVSYRRQHSFPPPSPSPFLPLPLLSPHTPLYRTPPPHRLQTLTPRPQSSNAKKKEKKRSRFKTKRSEAK